MFRAFSFLRYGRHLGPDIMQLAFMVASYFWSHLPLQSRPLKPGGHSHVQSPDKTPPFCNARRKLVPQGILLLWGIETLSFKRSVPEKTLMCKPLTQSQWLTYYLAGEGTGCARYYLTSTLTTISVITWQVSHALSCAQLSTMMFCRTGGQITKQIIVS